MEVEIANTKILLKITKKFNHIFVRVQATEDRHNRNFARISTLDRHVINAYGFLTVFLSY